MPSFVIRPALTELRSYFRDAKKKDAGREEDEEEEEEEGG